MFNEYKDVVSANDLCSMLGVGKNRAYALLQNGLIPHRRLGKKYYIAKNAVVQFVESWHNGLGIINSEFPTIRKGA